MSLGSRGGVGKTFTIALLVGWLLTKLSRCMVFDLDGENRKRGGLCSFIPEARVIDMHALAGLDGLLSAAEGGGDLIVADAPAASSHLMLPWFAEMAPFFAEQNLRVCLVSLITDFAGTVENTLRWADALQDEVRYLMVLNPLADPQAQFTYWTDSREAAAFRQAFDPPEIHLPSIRSDIMPFLEENGLTLHSAAEAETLPVALASSVTRFRIRQWRNFVFSQFNAIQNQLLP